jgi:hypothetical protein
VFVDVEDVILIFGLDSQVVQEVEELGAVVCAVVDHMQQHLPQDQVFVLPLGERFPGQHIVPQIGKITAHLKLDIVPMEADAVPVQKVGGVRLL